MKTMLTAATIALLPLSAMADAHVMTPEAMQESFSMLESNVANILETYGIEVGVQDLTVAQMAQVIGVANSSESEGEVGERIEAIVME